MRVRRYTRLSDLPGLSVLTRTTLLRLEARGEPVEQVVVDWHRMVADSKDRSRGDCATWGCCPPTVGVWTLLMMLESEMRRRDRERLYAELRWVESLG
ncbi:hypothetical protein [Kribbella sp. DT2]|uniref:hypothetical protein n=1 Tax=Kribbella sp. DT2 TaxID=3393427 RepID=UPI003CF47A90